MGEIVIIAEEALNAGPLVGGHCVICDGKTSADRTEEGVGGVELLMLSADSSIIAGGLIA